MCPEKTCSVVRLENTTKPQGPMETHITDIAHVIQLSVAPVFLLTAISTLIGAMNTRLGRIIDRRRVITEIQGNNTGGCRRASVISKAPPPYLPGNFVRRCCCTLGLFCCGWRFSWRTDSGRSHKVGCSFIYSGDGVDDCSAFPISSGNLSCR